MGSGQKVQITKITSSISVDQPICAKVIPKRVQMCVCPFVCRVLIFFFLNNSSQNGNNADPGPADEQTCSKNRRGATCPRGCILVIIRHSSKLVIQYKRYVSLPEIGGYTKRKFRVTKKMKIRFGGFFAIFMVSL